MLASVLIIEAELKPIYTQLYFKCCQSFPTAYLDWRYLVRLHHFIHGPVSNSGDLSILWVPGEYSKTTNRRYYDAWEHILRPKVYKY